MSDDADLIRKMIEVWFGGDQSDDSADMARVLAVVREHGAPVAKRVPVQIAADKDFDTILALSNDHRIFVARWSGNSWVWTGTLPPLPQPGTEP